MLRFLISFSLFLCLSLLNGQDVTVELSPEFKLPTRQVFQKHLYSDATGHYVYFYEYSSGLAAKFGGDATLLFEKYSPDFKLLIGKEFQSGESKVYTVGMKYLKGSFAWLLGKWDNKADYMTYQFVPISREGVASDPLEVAKVRYELRRGIPDTWWVVSEDTTSMLFSAFYDSKREEQPIDMFFDVRDAQLAPMWQKQFKLDYTEKQVDVRDMALGNDGTVYVLVKIYEGDKAKETKKVAGERVANYQMAVWHFEPGKDTPGEYRLNLSGAFVKDASIEVTPQGDLGVVGFFANDFKGLVRGAFLMKMAAGNGEVLLAQKEEFSAKDLELMGDDNTDSKRGEEGLEGTFRFQDVHFLENGSTFITAEENFSITYQSGSPTTGYSTRTVYYSRDIIVLLFGPEGKLDDVVVIPKRQRMENTNFFLGFATIQGKDKAYFFYNEDRQNLKKPIGERTRYVSSFQDGISVVTSLDSNGNLERTPLFDTRDVESLFVADLSSPIDESSLFFVALKPNLLAKSNFRMGKIMVK
jgi:hypothetical protein